MCKLGRQGDTQRWEEDIGAMGPGGRSGVVVVVRGGRVGSAPPPPLQGRSLLPTIRDREH